MDVGVLLFTALLAVSAAIVAMAVINMRKRQRRAEEKERQQREEEQKKAEDGRSEVDEVCKRNEEKSQQNIEETHDRERLLPDKRGGRPRGSIEQSETEQMPGTKSRSLKPEIVCWNEGWRWIVGIEVPEGLESPSVTQNEERLEQDSADELRYRLNHAEGTVRVIWTRGEKDISLVGPARNYLIFKMRKSWNEPGRLVRCSTTGYYLIVVPQEWKRDEEVSGSGSGAPESVQLEGYKAHFFYQE